jgi:hypothetical protein
MANQALSTQEIQAIFAEEISDAGGLGSDIFDDCARLFARTILPWVADVRPQDQMKGGVALKAEECEICVHPYLFRTVCRNGAIMAHAIETRRIENSDVLPREKVVEELRDAVHGCCGEEVFAAATQEIRSSMSSPIDFALTMMPFISRLPAAQVSGILGEIFKRFFDEPDRSRFGLMNAVTSVARDTRDREWRWRLEELGGAIGAAKTPTPSTFHPSAAAILNEWNNSPERGEVELGLTDEICEWSEVIDSK